MQNRVGLFVQKLKEKNLSIALAESVTCGMATEKLGRNKGISGVLKGSIICYSPDVKRDLMQVSEKVLEEFTAESPEVTEILVNRLEKMIKADIYASVTGLSSEGGSETPEKPVGTIFFCIKYKGEVSHYRKLLKGSALQIQEKACFVLFDLILSRIA